MSPKTVDSRGNIRFSGFWWQLARPGVILTLNGALIAAALVYAAVGRDLAWFDLVAGTLAGLVGWTAFEYVLHRVILHHKRIPILKKILWGALHKEHHRVPTMIEPEYRSIHPVITVPLLAAVLIVTAMLSEGGLSVAVAAGWVVGFCLYEWAHAITHMHEAGSGPLRMRYLRYLHETHRIHHFVNPNMNYGFVTLVWDRVFGTYLSPAEARVRYPNRRNAG